MTQDTARNASILCTRCSSSLEDVHRLLLRVDAYLRASEAPQDWREDMNIILSEVLSNIARHGYGHERGAIDLEIRISSRELWCSVSDSGAPFDPKGMGRTAPEPALLREGGYGWFLIRSLARKLTYRRKGGVNCLTFWVPVCDHAPLAALSD